MGARGGSPIIPHPGHAPSRDILNFLVEVRQPRPRVKFPRSREARREGFCRRNRRGWSAAGGWGRELNLRHCHPG